VLKNYLKIALRNIRKYKLFTFLNVAGLVIAFTSAIFIALYVFDELNFDRFHEHAEQIYRVSQKIDPFGFTPATSSLLAARLVDEFPEIKAATRIQRMNEPVHMQSGDQVISESDYLAADNSILTVFTFPLTAGDPQQALTSPNSVVITHKMAAKYFGDQNPVGRVLHVNIRSKWYDLQVTGVLEEIPLNSDVHVDFILSWSTLYGIYDQPVGQQGEPQSMDSWNRIGAFTYVLLEPASDVENLESKFIGFIQKYMPAGFVKSIRLEPLRYIHLYHMDDTGTLRPAAILYVYLFSAISILILLIAGMNFVILSTASASVRMKEIGMRKVAGARRVDIVKQFLSESVLLAFIALPLAVLMAELLLPWVNTLFNKQFDANYFQFWPLLLVLLGITLMVGVLSGGYTALYLSGIQPLTALKNKTDSGHSRGRLRKALIITQITIFIALMVSSLVIYKQLRYVQNTQLGFDKEQLIAVDMGRSHFEKNFHAFQTDVMQNPGVVDVSAGSMLPLPRTGVIFRETTMPGHPDEKIRYHAGIVDYDFFKTLKANVLAGRVFSRDFSQDATGSVVINQMAADAFGLENPVGSLIQLQDGPKRIIGVVNDFIVSGYHKASPMVYNLNTGSPAMGSMILRLRPGNMNKTIQFLEKIWKKYAPDAVFDFQFVDQELNRQYANDRRLSKILTIFTGVAILIAAFGLFGLALFLMKRRTKEIGVRKVLGATIPDLMYLQYKEIIYMVIIGNLIAWPIAWYAMHRWLQNFAYRIDISWWIFGLAGGLALIIALLTVSWQAVRAATANPVESLRYE